MPFWAGPDYSRLPKRYLNIKLSVLFAYNNFVNQHPQVRIAYRTVCYNTVKQLYAFLHLLFAFLYGGFNILHLNKIINGITDFRIPGSSVPTLWQPH